MKPRKSWDKLLGSGGPCSGFHAYSYFQTHIDIPKYRKSHNATSNFQALLFPPGVRLWDLRQRCVRCLVPLRNCNIADLEKRASAAWDVDHCDVDIKNKLWKCGVRIYPNAINST